MAAKTRKRSQETGWHRRPAGQFWRPAKTPFRPICPIRPKRRGKAEVVTNCDRLMSDGILLKPVTAVTIRQLRGIMKCRTTIKNHH